ncbi:MAG: flagellar export protein FliJ [Gammaproteobacteria bacterium]
MKKSDRLKTIVEFNADQEKKALEAYGAIQQEQLQMQRQLQQLLDYRRQYREKFDTRCESGARVTQVLEFKSFLTKLDQAIAGQEQMLDQVEAELNRLRSHWLGLHNKTKSLEKICDNAKVEEKRERDKRDQAELDDRLVGSRRNGSNGVRNA